jgi:phospholipid transport system substrate-binding protein
MLNIRLRPVSLAAALAAALTLAAPARADAVAESRQVISAMAETVVAILANKGLPKAQREERFRQIYKANFDHAIIAASVMGPPWRGASPAARDEYLQVFETYIAKVYAAQLSAYSGEKLEVTKAEADGPGATIESRIVDPKSGRTVGIIWRLRPTDGKLKVRDVMIENISMALTQRREFAAVLQQRGGKAEGLIAAIREKIADLDKKK